MGRFLRPTAPAEQLPLSRLFGALTAHDADEIARWPQYGNDEWDVDGVPKFRLTLTLEE